MPATGLDAAVLADADVRTLADGRVVITLADGAQIAPPAGDGGSDDSTLSPPVALDASADANADARINGLAACLPAASAGPYWVLEGSALQVQLRCASGEPGALYNLAFDAPPAGASYDAASSTLSWTPALDQAANYELSIHALATGEAALVKIGVVDRWDDPNNVPVVDERAYTEEYGLPVLHLHPDPAIGESYKPAKVVYRGHEYQGAEAQYRGAFSFSFPKRSYTLKFTKVDKFTESIKAGGFQNKRKITLVTPFNDNSYLRSRLAFDLWNSLDPQHILVQSYSAVVFLDGVYHGIYTVIDHVDEYLMEDFGLAQEGNLYKARSHDANFRLTAELGEAKTTLHQGYTKEEGTPADGEPGAYDDLDAFVSWVANSTPDAFASEIDSRIVRKEYEDWFLFVSFIMAGDTIGKNTYHYHDPLMAGSRWRFIPWDLDESFGQNYRTSRAKFNAQTPEAGRYSDFNNLWQRMLADQAIGAALRARYGSTLGGAFSVAALTAHLDEMAAEIADSAQRDEGKWGVAYKTYGNWKDRADFQTHDGELEYIRQWIKDRHAFIDSIY